MVRYTLYQPADDFGDVEVILEQIYQRTADYYKPRCMSRNKKTIAVNVMIQNMFSYIFITFILCVSFNIQIGIII